MTDDTRPAATCDHPEHARLQAAVVELLHEQVRDLRRQVREQTVEMIELNRLIRVRDDLLHLQSQEIGRLRAARSPLVGWLARRLRGGDSST